MTGVPKMLLLPAPGAKPLAPSGAAGQGSGPRQPVEAVTRTTPPRSGSEEAAARALVEQRAGEGRNGTAGRDRAAAAQEPVKGRLVGFSRLSSMPFMVQVLGQQALAERAPATAAQSPLSQHRDGALMGSDLYRKAGGEPEFMPENATLVRFAV
ncbi:hypothetical protein [Pelagibius sp.]|uniref:hypothetical protein n=1 Tax=Pelagibius sp. TaxID=1931238 RepID=UPI003B501E55